MPRRTEPHPVAAKLGQRIQLLRQAREMSRGALARASGMSIAAIQGLEMGLSLATVETILALAKGLQVIPGFLLIFPQDGEFERVCDELARLPREELRRAAAACMRERRP